MEANCQQKVDKELRLAEQAKIEKDEYNRIIDAQLRSQEEDKKKEEKQRPRSNPLRSIGFPDHSRSERVPAHSTACLPPPSGRL